MENKNMTTGQFVRIALLTALAAVLTMFPKFPTPTGYVHFGDSVIYIASIFLGPVSGMTVGAIGHSLADIISGYPIYALPTFIIKGLMGWLIGKIAYQKIDVKHFTLAGLAALIIVTFGYFLAEWVMFVLLGLGDGTATLTAVLFVFISSPVQWGMSIAASAILIPIFRAVYRRIN